MTIRKALLCAVALLVAPMIGFTQPQSKAQPQTISGKEHPELIPDLTAYRLHLLAVSQPAAPTAEQAASQAAHLNMIRLPDQDTKAVVPILATFHAKYQALVDRFNSKAQAANAQGKDVDPATRQAFLAERDLLVRTTHDTLQSVLSAQGWAQWDGHVRTEKAHMRIPVEEGAK